MSDTRRGAVCIVRHNYYPDGHVRRDAETLAQAGYDVSVIALRRAGQPAREVLGGVSVHRLPVEHRRGSLLRYAWEYGAFFALAFLTVAVLHLRKRFRAIEVDNMPDLLVFSALVPKLFGVPVMLYIFDNMPELFMVTRGVGARHPMVRLLALAERLSAGFADHVIVTQEIARRVVAGRGVPTEKLSVLLNCPDETVFPAARDGAAPGATGARRSAGASSGVGAFRVATHGAVLERYGIRVLIESVPLLLPHIPDVRVEIYGEGEHRPVLEALAGRLGVGRHVTFRGLVPLDDLVSGLRSADAGFVGMLCDLMLSNKLMEYVALGVPVVISRWPTYEHYFPDGTVSYYEPGSAADAARALLAVYRDPAEAAARAVRAAELYDGYRWREQRAEYLRLYERATGVPHLPAPLVPVPEGR